VLSNLLVTNDLPEGEWLSFWRDFGLILGVEIGPEPTETRLQNPVTDRACGQSARQPPNQEVCHG
jgi:hypothetical protein